MFIEHHECTSCEDGTCEITTEHAGHHEHSSNCSSCSSEYQDINISDIHSCDIFDFENIEHHNHCACFADYFQIPVYQSESKSFNFIPETHTFLVVQYSFNQNFLLQKDINQIFANAPPNTHYQNIPIHIINCNFLC